MGIDRPKETHECLDCGGQRAHKPVAHQDSLDETLGYLCIGCYAAWVQPVDHDEECVICGDDSVYYTVRELSDFDGKPVLTTGLIGVCEEHIADTARTRTARPEMMH